MVSAASCVIHNVSSSNPPTQHHERHVRLCLSNKPKLARSKKRRNVITAVGHFTSWITEIGMDHPYTTSACMFVSCLDPLSPPSQFSLSNKSAFQEDVKSECSHRPLRPPRRHLHRRQRRTHPRLRLRPPRPEHQLRRLPCCPGKEFKTLKIV